MTATRVDVAIVGGGIVGTFLGQELVRRGQSVAIIEKGPRDLSERGPAVPQITCPERPHHGVHDARNQVLGGNGHFWGGGLIRGEREMALALCGPEAVNSVGDLDDLDACYAAIERNLGLHRAPDRRQLDGLGSGPYLQAEMMVLPSRRRNIAEAAIRYMERSGKADLLPSADIKALRFSKGGKRLRSIEFERGGKLAEVEARAFVIAAGTVDSILIVARHLQHHGLIGNGMHDHLSVPLFAFRARGAAAFRDLVAPTFERGLIVGRRYEMRADIGWGARGFLHFQFLFDESPPYRAIKNVLGLRQRGATTQAAYAAVRAALRWTPAFANIAWHRYARHKLFVSDDVPIVATLDFESFPAEKNALRLIRPDLAQFFWNIREEDEKTFHELLKKSSALVTDIAARYDAQADPLVPCTSAVEQTEYLHAKARDAYHLGGGLARGAEAEQGVVDKDLRIRGMENLFVISCAAFKRPGLANPTLTLLALALRFVMQQARF